MFSGAQISLYPMTDRFVSVITDALSALDPYRDRFRIETDDLSTLLVGPPEELFPAMRDLFVAAAGTGVHTVLSATVSRGCPGEPDDAACTPVSRLGAAPGQDAVEDALRRLADAPVSGRHVSAQLSYYPLGERAHMDEIYAVIDFLKRSGAFGRSKNFCTKLEGDAGLVFLTLQETFLRFAPEGAHLAFDLTVSANSPTGKG
ncbi:MAG: HMP/thiamine-binding protein [Methylobacterium mesophilicum]|nr:HMP/thiamine-binding protein [Methylobacterium mesophilicum]